MRISCHLFLACELLTNTVYEQGLEMCFSGFLSSTSKRIAYCESGIIMFDFVDRRPSVISAATSGSTGQPVYVQVMLQVGGHQQIPINIPAEMIIPSLVSALGGNRAESVGNGRSSGPSTPVALPGGVTRTPSTGDLRQVFPLLIKELVKLSKYLTSQVHRNNLSCFIPSSLIFSD
jgi:hypothetical protein